MTIYIDVTNLLQIDFLTGIQRVVREVTVRLVNSGSTDYVLLYYDPVKACFDIIDNAKFCDLMKNGGRAHRNCLTSRHLDVEQLKSQAIFFEIDGTWNSKVKRSVLYPRLKERGIRLITFIHDVIPITKPHLCQIDNVTVFMNYFCANLRYADQFLTSTQSVLDTLNELEQELGIQKIPGETTWLGADFQRSKDSGSIRSDVLSYLDRKRDYILIVGTIEPRKNHRLLLDVFEMELYKKGYDLVLAGRVGWNVADLAARIRKSDQLGRQLHFFEGLNDASISALYGQAKFTAFPTFDEGFGLPLVESFQHGIPAIASDIPVLREVGGDNCLYFESGSPQSFIDTLLPYLENPEQYAKIKHRAEQYRPVTWDTVAERFREILERTTDSL